MKKKLIAAVFAVAALRCNFTAAAQTYIDGYFEYVPTDGSVVITAYNGSEEVVTVPEMIAGEPVSAIESGVFPDSGTVREVYLPDTIVYVAEDSFGSGVNVIFSGVHPTTEATESVTAAPDIAVGGYEGTYPDESTSPTETSTTATVTEQATAKKPQETTAPETEVVIAENDAKSLNLPIIAAAVLCAAAGLALLLKKIGKKRV